MTYQSRQVTAPVRQVRVPRTTACVELARLGGAEQTADGYVLGECYNGSTERAESNALLEVY